MPSKSPRKLGIVLPAGGARAAYQVGVLNYIGEAFPKLQPRIFAGISAGSINASFLAQGEAFPKATKELHQLWKQLEFHQVLHTNFNTLFSMGSRWLYDLFLSKVTRKLLLKSLLDASPLASKLLQHIHFWKISKAIREGSVEGLAVTATNYNDGTSTIFFDSCNPIEGWSRERRIGIRTAIRLKHIMASCSIPILFEPIRIGDFFYGDGSLRFNFPFSPAIKLGATDLFAISIRCPSPQVAVSGKTEHAGLGFIAGAVLDSIFLDSLDTDYENLLRINRVQQKGGFSSIPVCVVRPSKDLGFIAKDFLAEVPFHLRQLLRSTASPEELGDLLSYLMFSPGYVGTLLNLGFKDAENQHADLEKFLSPLF